MTTTEDVEQGATPPRPNKRTTEASVLAALVEAAERAESRAAYLRSALARIADALHAPFALLEASHSSSVLYEEYDGGSSDPSFWREPLRELLTDVLTEPRPIARLFRGDSEVRLGLFAVPLLAGHGGTLGALTLAVPLPDRNDAERVLATLESLATVVGLSADALDGAEHGTGAPSATKSAERTLKSLRQASDHESSVDLAMAIVNRLRTRDEIDQVALGVVRGSRLQLLAISGLDDIETKSPGVAALQHAMEECLDFGDALCTQGGPSDGIAAGGRMHDAWHSETGDCAVASLPLRDEGRTAAVLTLRKGHGKRFRAQELAETAELVAPYALSLELLERADRGLLRHFAQTVRDLPRGFGSLHAAVRKLTVLAATIAFAWFCFGSMPYRISAETELQPAEERHVGAPRDARLIHAGPLPGSVVSAGSVLCEFDAEDARLEERRLQHELAVLEIEESRALAADDPGAARLARARMGELLAGIAIVRDEIEHAVVRAPVDGTILSGDLRDRLGDRFTKGESLFRVAGGEHWILELEVDERDVPEVRVGMTGAFSSFARPEVEHALTVRRVSPAAEERAGRNVFLVEAEVEVGDEWAKSGMEGVARLDAGHRRPVWIAFHGVVDTLRMHAPR